MTLSVFIMCFETYGNATGLLRWQRIRMKLLCHESKKMSGFQKTSRGGQARLSLDLGRPNSGEAASAPFKKNGRAGSSPLIPSAGWNTFIDRDLGESTAPEVVRMSTSRNIPPPPPPPPPPLPKNPRAAPQKQSSNKAGQLSKGGSKDMTKIPSPPPNYPPPPPPPPKLPASSPVPWSASRSKPKHKNETPSASTTSPRGKSPQSNSSGMKGRSAAASKAGSKTNLAKTASPQDPSIETPVYTSTYQISITDPNCTPGFYCGGECAGTPSYPRYPPGHFDTRRNRLGPDFGKNIPKGFGEPCRRCGRPVFLAELQLGYHGAYHTECFKCCSCGKKLDSTTVAEHQGEIFCNGCYRRNFGTHGCGFGVGAGTLQTP